MRTIKLSLACLLFPMLCLSSQRVDKVFGFPATEPGYSLGVSACYAGRIGDYLVMAGGCNFPEPGHKTYYSGIYAAHMDEEVLTWRIVGWLPESGAYGVAVESGDSLIFIGGNNAEHGLRTVYSVHLDDGGGKASVHRLDDLPCTMDNMSCAQDGDDVYLVGGNRDGRPSSDVLRMSLDKGLMGNSQWQRIGSVPGEPRVQPVSVASDGKLYVWGGFFADGERSVVHTDGYRFDGEKSEWTRLDAPRSMDGDEMTLSGGIAWTIGDKAYATGGVNHDIFLDAISGRYERVRQAEYLLQPIGWYRFSGNLYEFDLSHDTWLPTRFASESLARAGAQAVVTEKGVYYIGGELKPALRTPQIVVVKYW